MILFVEIEWGGLGQGFREVTKTVQWGTINSSGPRTIPVRVYPTGPRYPTRPLELLNKNEKGRILTGTPGIPFSWSIQNLHFFSSLLLDELYNVKSFVFKLFSMESIPISSRLVEIRYPSRIPVLVLLPMIMNIIIFFQR